MLAEIIVAVVIIGTVTAIGLKGGIDWSKNMGGGMGHTYMKEYGLEEDKKHQDESGRD